MFDAALDAVIGMAADGRIIDWNRQAEEIFGWSRAEAIGAELASLVVPPHLRGAHRHGLGHYLATGEWAVLNKRIEIVAHRRGGAEFPVELTIIPLHGADDPVFYAFVRDITKRVEAERRLAQSALEAQLLTDVTVLAAEGNAPEDVFRISLEKVCALTGWPLGHVYRPDDPQNPQCLVSAEIWHAESAAFDEAIEVSRRRRFKSGEGLPGLIWASGRPQWIEDIGRNAAFPRAETFARAGIKAAFGFPVFLEDRLQAVLEFFSTTERPPEPQLLLLARNLAEQIGRALERRQAEESRDLLLRELNHRVANSITVIVTLFRQTLRHAPSPEALRESFEARLRAIADANRILASGNWSTTDVRDVVRTALSPFCPDGPACAVEGPEVRLRPQIVMSLSLVLHELATNAVKYGALSQPDGRLSVDWRFADAEPRTLVLTWRERKPGGLAEAGARRRGFGTKLIESTIERGLSGRVSTEYEPTGLAVEFTLPLA